VLKLIIHPSTLLLNFVLSLCLSLSKPQRLHVLRTVEALIVTDERKTLSGLYRQWVEAPDVSAVADFFRVSPWSGEEMGQGLSRFVMADMMQRAEAQGIKPIIYASIDDSLTSKDSHLRSAFSFPGGILGINPRIIICVQTYRYLHRQY